MIEQIQNYQLQTDAGLVEVGATITIWPAWATTQVEALIPCPECGGSGESGFIPVTAKRLAGSGPLTGPAARALAELAAKCHFCGGTRHVSVEQIGWRETGKLWKARRINAGYGLRAWAEHVGCLPSDYCHMEHGRLQPDERYMPPES